VKNSFLPYARQQVDDDDVAAVTAALRSDWLTTGPAVRDLEAAFTKLVGAKHAVACSSGTAGLHMAALALELGPSDAVIVPAVTFLATANAARYTNAEVIFADVDPDTGLMQPEHLLEALERTGQTRPRAVFPVHLAGQCADLPTMAEIATTRGLATVEDAAHAIGSKYGGNDYGHDVGGCSHSDMAVFSLHPVKTATMAEGGLVTTNDDIFAERLALARNHGMERDAAKFQHTELAFAESGEANPWYYEMEKPGYNYRATDLQCALGLSQLGKLAGFVERRRQIVALYDQRLHGLSPALKSAGRSPGNAPGWHLYSVLIDFEMLGKDRATVIRELGARGIGTQVHYLPVCHQPYYRQRYGLQDVPGADAYYARQLSLPLFPAMHDDDVERVVAALADVLD